MTNSFLRSKRMRWLLPLGGLLVVALVGAAIFGIVVTQAAPPQPFPYRHAPHVVQGIECQFCHAGAYRYQSATLPTRAKCQGCHANMAADTPALQAVNEFLNQPEEIKWVPVAIMPDFVYFSHQPHIAGGVACETCHGDVGNMDAAEPTIEMTMGWCLSCHQQQGAEKFVKLSDCVTCHK
jgi:hypothetical protein